MKDFITCLGITLGLIIIAFLITTILSSGITPYPATLTFYELSPLAIFGSIKAFLYSLSGLGLIILAGQKIQWAKRTDLQHESASRFIIVFLLISISSVLFSLFCVLLFGGAWHIVSTILLGILCLISTMGIILRKLKNDRGQ